MSEKIKQTAAPASAAPAKPAGQDSPKPSAAAATPAPAKKNNLAKHGILQFDIPDTKALYACFMPFVKGCGIFVPSNDTHKLGDELFLLLKLPEDKGEFATAAKVVWINPKQKLGRRIPGVGLQIKGRDTHRLHETIEEILGKKVNSPLPTATM